MRRVSRFVALIFLLYGFISLYNMYERLLERELQSTVLNLQVDSGLPRKRLNRLQTFNNSEMYNASFPPQLRLVLGYMRGGSTLTADLVRHTEGDFYMFEPLHALSQAVRWENTTMFLNGTERAIKREILEFVYPEMIYHWFTCNFTQIDLTALTDPFIAIHTPEHMEYYQCFEDNMNRSMSLIESVKDCVDFLNAQCLTAKTRTIKTVRMSMSMAEKLLKWLPDLKVIYIIRDPRGILNSQFEQHVTEVKNMSFTVKNVCDAIYSDSSHLTQMEVYLKSRIKSIIYENLCQNPLKLVPEIYMFLKAEYTKEEEDYVRQIMNGPVKICHYCTDRGDALGNAYRWIHVIKEDTLITIDHYCSFLYTKFGYQHLEFDNLNTTRFSWILVS
ncbi:carbohydrate sulfotransferase 1-like [Saccostrea cucullata]|uniref:carbohydrate sulfotransferase 1-like n=1 Tax=Saccostrea cuccullata TaxID=36930 RepID=UPI002ED52ADD